jgi:hypothetical protein
MTRRLVFILIVLLFIPAVSDAQPVVFINAGSRANYGNHQELTIDAQGNCRYYLRDVNGVSKDSSFFSITRQQLDSFFQKANAVGFFQLNAKYDVGAVDGAGIYISMNSSGRKHSVQVLNTDVSAVNELIAWLNALLAPRQIRIYYGQK